ncbi:MAG: GAF and ANTAR domain-containing protein [Actinomycetales bacterium]|nr:GAF and ANTAR domain-containing protein [Actinomycetales bacterium]
MSTLSTDRVAEVFVEFADTLVEEFDVVEFLQMVATRAAELVDSAAAGLLLADGQGQLQFMAASDERTHLLELFQVQAVEGPCQDCYREGSPVVNADLTEAHDRWPQFTPRALATGFRSVHAFPLRLRQDVIGALNMFGTQEGNLDPTDIRVIQALADIATIGLLQERAVREATVLSQQLQSALQSRVSIEQAKGALAQIRGVGVDDAFDLMRRFARSHNLALSDVARDVVLAPTNVPELTQP